jgi:hypothetical protein
LEIEEYAIVDILPWAWDIGATAGSVYIVMINKPDLSIVFMVRGR